MPGVKTGLPVPPGCEKPEGGCQRPQACSVPERDAPAGEMSERFEAHHISP